MKYAIRQLIDDKSMAAVYSVGFYNPEGCWEQSAQSYDMERAIEILAALTAASCLSKASVISVGKDERLVLWAAEVMSAERADRIREVVSAMLGIKAIIFDAGFHPKLDVISTREPSARVGGDQ